MNINLPTVNLQTRRSRVGVRALAGLLLLTASKLILAQELGDHQYTSEAIEAGSRVYTQQCALCHGPQGDLIDGINLRRGQFRTAQSDADLVTVISQGAAEGRMPSFDLRFEELNGVIAYIRAGFDPDGIAVKIGDPVRGKALFEGKGECADCHRVNGVGPRTAPDLSSIGAIRTPASLQRNMLDPATALLPINRPVRIVTRNEETIVGRRLNEDTYTVQVIDSNERLRSLRKSDLVTFEISDAPSKQPTTLSSDEVADVVGYLLTLRGLR
ncbi:MAG: c-type cytochrome [Pseudohongiella sp.]|nr:c-type cytochrome [Pseudohongiella sp.]